MPGEILQAGDEVDVGVNCSQWVPTQRGGVRIGDEEDSYRRRVTPVRPPLLSRVEQENVWLKAEVERLRLRPVPETPQTRETTRASKEFAAAVNRLSLEGGSNTPDWVIGDFLAAVLAAFDSAVNARHGGGK